MLRLKKPIFILVVILLFVAACSSSGGPATSDPTDIPEEAPTEESEPASRAIVLGDISDDPAEVIEGAQPLADYLAENLSDYGITEGQVRVAATTDEMIDLFNNGEVDIYFDSVYPATIISDTADAAPLLRRWRFGVEEYYTVIFASKDSGITSLDDLPGQMVAMDNPFSSSGFVLPSVFMIEHGLNLVGKENYDSAVAEDEVGIVFSNDDENTLQWVLSGLVGAGATDDYNFYVAISEEARANLVVLAETDKIPRQVVVVRTTLEPELIAAIVDILTSMHEDEAAGAVLENFQTTRFDEFPEGIEAAQERMREMRDIVLGIPMP